MEKTIKKVITYKNDIFPDAKTVAELYRKALLNRPVDDLNRIEQIYKDSNIILTAWNNEELVGILRGWTDGAFHGYVCDLAIHPDYQNCGIGKELLKQVVSISPQIEFVLRSSKIAKDYYEHIGWEKIENGWFSPRKN